ncbi:ORF-34 [Agrotis segetum nucleopolyhedrovirus A]|uniref:ORF-34 n=1 Tax=Agrotis segetum nuclear polyhedrosis virus TaxID=1962501 RepID=Q287N8_NPVAS|nr:ORF-34 [Agrotis segetum nucleopolyhedrovirus A]AAZ38200.1 ORF-34 [Agrotis segetum nucleopolyhedrovirus A]
MHIKMYILAVTSVEAHIAEVIDNLLLTYFCPVFAVHGILDTLAVCEDKVYTDDKRNHTFKCYENFLHTEQSETVAVTIQEYGDLNQKYDMIQKIVQIMEENDDGVIVLSNYF